jgi:hypothetical protein
MPLNPGHNLEGLCRSLLNRCPFKWIEVNNPMLLYLKDPQRLRAVSTRILGLISTHSKGFTLRIVINLNISAPHYVEKFSIQLFAA